jgi:hypothetical protein
MKRLKKFEELVHFACDGEMKLCQVEDMVRKLKTAKSDAMKAIAGLPTQEQRQTALCQLNAMMYRLYKAVALDRRKSSSKEEDKVVRVSVGIIAYMVLCYRC